MDNLDDQNQLGLNILPFFNVIDDTELQEEVPYGGALPAFRHMIFNPFENRQPDEQYENEHYHQNANYLSNKCKYKTVPELSALMQSINQDQLSLIHFNARSLLNKKAVINNFLEELKTNPIKFIGVSETWLNKNTEQLANFENYSAEFSSRKDKEGGGVALYILNNINYKVRNDLKLECDQCSSITVEVLNEKSKNILITVVYKPPNINPSHFNEKLDVFLTKLSQDNKLNMVMGDFNLDLLQFQAHNPTEDFLNMMYSHNLEPLIFRPTRVVPNTATLLDNIFTNINNIKVSNVILTDFSDHFPVFTCTQTNISKIKDKTVSFRKFSENNLNKFKGLLNEIVWDELYTIEDVNLAYNLFEGKILKAYNESFPLTTKRVKYFNDNSKPWLTNGILVSSKTKNKMYCKYLKHPTQANLTQYKNYKNRLSSLIKTSEKIYYRNKFENASGNIKQTWDTINDILKRKRKSTKVQLEFKINNNKTTNKQLIANGFNNYFASVGKTLSDKISPSQNSSQHYLNSINSTLNSIFLEPTTPDEITTLITLLKDSASSLDELKPIVIKKTGNLLTNPLLHIFNKSLETGIFPDKLKQAKVIPLHKSDEKDSFNQYRPISILPVFSKLLEKNIHKRLIDFIDKHNILFKKQFGFRKNRSTYMAVLSFVEKIRIAIDNGNLGIGIFADLSKAFDTINHEILIKRLNHDGIRDIASNLLKNYLENRQQIVFYNGTKSDTSNITCGVPQGSVLGPLLFILYINDIYAVSDNLDFTLFADDTSILNTNKNLNDLQAETNEELKKLNDWFKANKLSLNISKTKYIIFSSRKIKIAKNQIVIKLNENPLERVESTKFLGVYVDKHLLWKEHIKIVESKIAKTIGLLYKVKYLLNRKAMMTIYNSLFLSYINYCNIIWGNNYKTYLNKILRYQKSFLRIITSSDYRAHTLEYFKQYKLLNIFELIKYNTAQFVYCWIKRINEFSKIFSNFYNVNTDIHSHNTRQKEDIHPIKFKSNVGKYSLKYQGAIVWNKIESDIKKAKSLNIFKREYKEILIAQMQH